MLFDQPHLACHECDLLVNAKNVKVGQKLECPRCGYLLYRPRKDVINRGLALSLTTLILIVPANFLPIMSLSMLGLENVDTMVKGVVQLYLQGFWWMAFLVFVCSMAAPLLESLLIVAICLMVKANLINRLLVQMLKLQAQVRRWAMLEVYMLSILVAYIKMIDEGELSIGVGLICFSAMLVAVTLNTLLFNTHMIWEMIGKRREQQLQNR